MRVKHWTGGEEKNVIQQISYLLTVLASEKITTTLFRELRDFLTNFIEKVKVFKRIIEKEISYASDPQIEELLLTLLDKNYQPDNKVLSRELVNEMSTLKVHKRWTRIHIHEQPFHEALQFISSDDFLGMFTLREEVHYGLAFHRSDLCRTAGAVKGKITGEIPVVIFLVMDCKSETNRVLNVIFYPLRKEL